MINLNHGDLRDNGGMNGAESRSDHEASLVDLSALAVPVSLYGGRYELEELLGAGASGSVYRARDVELNEIVALKVLRKELVGNPQTLEHFRNEVRLARRVTHPNVARMFDIGEHEGERFLTMELVEGTSLSQRMNATVDGKKQPLPLAEVVELIDQVCAGLEAAHKRGVVHCDLKPDNLLIGKDGRVVITDFGIARGLNPGAGSGPAPTSERAGAGGARAPHKFDGTPLYISPEQVSGAVVDARADIYSLGVVLYELLTGVPPFTGSSLVAVIAARLLRPPPDPQTVRPGLPTEVARTILRCLAIDPAQRFQHASELARALRAAVASSGDTTLVFAAAPVSPVAREPHADPAASAAVSQLDVNRRMVADLEPHESSPVLLPVAGLRTVAVLPLVNQGAAEDDFLADGLSQELIDGLGTLRGVRIYSRAAVSMYKGHDAEPLVVGRELGAELVVTGTVRRSGDRLRIAIRMINTSDGIQVFGSRRECAAGEVLAASESLTSAIAEALLVDRSERQRAVPEESSVVEKYLRARYLYARSDPASLEQSIQLFESVLAQAPGDPLLLMNYALARSRLWFYGSAESGAKALAAAEQAVVAMPQRGESFLALASVSFQGADLVAAVRALGRALTLTPELADAHELLGRILVETGPIRDGIERLTLSRKLDPGLFRTLADQARTLALLGDFDRAHALLAEPALSGRSFAIQWILRGRLCVWSRDVQRAREYLNDPEIMADRFPRARLLLEVAAGRGRVEPPAVMGTGLASDKSSPRGRTFFFQMHAELYSFYGLREQAVRCVARSVDAGLTDLTWLERCPPIVALADDPKMTALKRVVYERAYAVREALPDLRRPTR